MEYAAKKDIMGGIVKKCCPEPLKPLALLKESGVFRRQGFGKSRADTERAAFLEKGKCSLKSGLSALIFIWLTRDKSAPAVNPALVNYGPIGHSALRMATAEKDNYG